MRKSEPRHLSTFLGRRVRAFLSIAVWILAGCPVSNQISSVALARTPVTFSSVEKGSYSGIREPLQIVIRDQREWAAFWTRHSSIKSKPSLPPEVDFSAEMVAGIFLGEKSTGGYIVEISTVELDGSNMRLYYREKSPAPDAMVTQVLTQPFHLIKLQKYNASPIFIRENP